MAYRFNSNFSDQLHIEINHLFTYYVGIQGEIIECRRELWDCINDPQASSEQRALKEQIQRYQTERAAILEQIRMLREVARSPGRQVAR